MTRPDAEQSGRVWEVIEIFDGAESVVARCTTKEHARGLTMRLNLTSAPTEPGDEWGPDHYFREAQG